LSKLKEASQGTYLRASLVGEQKPLLVAGDTFTSARMPTKPEELAIPEGYVGITDLEQGVVVSVLVAPVGSKAANKAIRHSPTPI